MLAFLSIFFLIWQAALLGSGKKVQVKGFSRTIEHLKTKFDFLDKEQSWIQDVIRLALHSFYISKYLKVPIVVKTITVDITITWLA